MIGAIVGEIAGSCYELSEHKSKGFILLLEQCQQYRQQSHPWYSQPAIIHQ